ncbi:ribosome assembly cofactor RimP [Antarcticibacterium sp. 1MA-6-2]|uniref:ribosome assembly cofactor RimP n=1 Tax=Antarcticibacterium sp. 1MA-6-2 TaxID=2908210 RepID=UPI001F2520CB|nr:ribosome assembly cofactor RimP [Antarcticibacterium sp. 1MA-6-2]UJH90857.1 ribosome assembly cofactor RimP [Antarcticibacterium sp. 1MA-6-2]
MLQEKVENLLKEAFEENNSLFLISLNINDQNHILVVIDGDEGVAVNDCIAVSRKIEHNLDREEIDFSLEVTSAGVSEPLQLPRQYKKNIGRKLEVRTKSDKFEGDLIAVDDEGITLTWTAREPKPVGKGKMNVDKEAKIAFADIEQAKVVITF